MGDTVQPHETRNQGAAAQPPPSLDEATHSVETNLSRLTASHRQSSGRAWTIKAWPEAREASISYALIPEVGDPEAVEVPHVRPGEAADSARAAQESARRARRTVRRYCVANTLDKLWSLTYAVEPDDWDDVWLHIETFRRRLWAHLGRKLPMLSVIEAGSESGRLHVHLALGEFVDQGDLTRLWGHGHTWVQRLDRGERARAQRSRKARARVAASYLAGYLQQVDGGKKEHAQDGRQFCGKRYSTTRGFAPTSRSVRVDRRDEAWAVVAQELGGMPQWSWSSDELGEKWEGPPVWVGFW